jgi:hypothetical protein
MGGIQMKIQTFRNMKGLIHGRDPKRIDCDRDGVLKIGTTEIIVSQGGDTVLPVLFHGSTGDYVATFTDEFGNTYDLGKVEVRNGRINPPSPIDVELMDLRSKADILEAENEVLKQKIEFLENIFDTNSLNFLIG